MKPFSALFDSAAAHGLLLNWFHQDAAGRWKANWRRKDAGSGYGFSPIVDGDDGFETLSRSLMVALAELAPAKPDDAFWE